MGDSLGTGVTIFGFVIAAPLLGFVFITWPLHYFVALTSPPSRRAAWTVGIAYLILAAICVFSFPLEYWWAAPVAPIPAALIAFWWWRNDFRRGWIDDAQVVPEGVELETDDWRIGLLQLLALISIALGAAVLKYVFRAL